MGGQGGIPKSSILNLIFFPRVLTHKAEMRAPWSALVRNLLGLVLLVNLCLFTSKTRPRSLRTSVDQGAVISALITCIKSPTPMDSNGYLKLINTKKNNVSIQTITNKQIYKIRKTNMCKYRECLPLEPIGVHWRWRL